MSEKVIKSKNVKLSARPAVPRPGISGGPASGNKDLSLKAVLRGDGNIAREGEILSESREADYERGFAEGMAFQKKEQLHAVNALLDVMKELGQLKEKLYSEAEDDMLNMIFSITERIIYDEVSINRNVVKKVLKEAVKNVIDGDGMNIRLSPPDYRFLLEIKHDFLQELSGWKNVTLEEDARIKPGGAVLETVSGEVDARLDRQLKEIQTALKVR